jgi:L-iditol 2-dehydrogenase
MKMKAAVLLAPGNIEIQEVPIPLIGDDDVLVKVKACGVCGSDVPRVLVTGTYHFPTIPGHEFSGRVVEAGKNVKELIDKNVAVIPLIPCNDCAACSIGEFAQCQNYDFLGSRSDGGFAQYVKVPGRNVVILPDTIDLVSGALLEPITVALHAVESLSVKYGDTVAVFGLGAIGIFLAQWAHIMGASVFAVDLVTEKVDIAKNIGIEKSICSINRDIKEILLAETNGKGVDYAFDASGANAAISQAISSLRHFGKLGLIGRVAGNFSVDEKTFEKILRSQLQIQGVWSFQMKEFPHNAWDKSVLALSRGEMQVTPLITHRFPLEKTEEAVRLLGSKDNSVHKILILPNDE